VEGCAAGAVVRGRVYGMRRGGVPVVCETWVRLRLFVVIPVESPCRQGRVLSFVPVVGVALSAPP